MYEILSGAIMMACIVAGLFFLRFWKKSRDRLFLMFSAAFMILAVERMVLGIIGTQHEHGPKVYLIRASAFVLILIAIIQKNRESEKS